MQPLAGSQARLVAHGRSCRGEPQAGCHGHVGPRATRQGACASAQQRTFSGPIAVRPKPAPPRSGSGRRGTTGTAAPQEEERGEGRAREIRARQAAPGVKQVFLSFMRRRGAGGAALGARSLASSSKHTEARVSREAESACYLAAISFILCWSAGGATSMGVSPLRGRPPSARTQGQLGYAAHAPGVLGCQAGATGDQELNDVKAVEHRGLVLRVKGRNERGHAVRSAVPDVPARSRSCRRSRDLPWPRAASSHCSARPPASARMCQKGVFSPDRTGQVRTLIASRHCSLRSPLRSSAVAAELQKTAQRSARPRTASTVGLP
jgi:hypothetical protein